MDINHLWGGWKIDELLGEGSFGQVYRIVREDFGHTYMSALKVIRVPQSKNELAMVMEEGMDEESVTTYFQSLVEDIVDEFALMSKLRGNSNIVSYEDHEVIPCTDGFGWEICIRMELLTPLYRYIKEHKLTIRDVIKLGIDICKALEVCQKYNIIHRDIKPANIFYSELGDFKLGDFGIARQMEKTSAGMSKKGTYEYMAPEVYKGLPYNSTVDIYSLGIVLYQFLNNNRKPFMPPYPQKIRYADKENANILRMSGQTPEKPCNAEGRLGEIVLKACAYDPKDRYESARQMREELESVRYTAEEKELIYPGGDTLENLGSRSESVQDQPDQELTADLFGMSPQKRLLMEEKKRQQEELRRQEKIEQERIKREEQEKRELELRIQKEREEKEKLEAERKELERREKEEAERKEKERKAKEEAERIEKERKAKEEAERKEKERKAKEEAERIEKERKTKEEAERKEKERKAEKERKRKEAEDRKRQKEKKKQEQKAEKERIKNTGKNQSGEKKKKRNWWLLLFVVLVVVIILIAVLLSQRNQGTASQSDDSAETTVSESAESARSEQEEITVPSVIGLSKDEAIKKMAEAGLYKSNIKEVYDDSTPKGAVVRQTPEAGTLTKEEIRHLFYTAELEISLGEEKLTIPNVIGVKKEKALNMMSEAGLYRSEIKEVYDDQVKKGKVVSQSPKEGELKKDEASAIRYTVTLKVSKGVKKVTVPNVVGMSRDKASSKIKKLGLKVNTKNYYSSYTASGNVISQSVEAGKKLKLGTTVELRISIGKRPSSSANRSSTNTKKSTSGRKGTTKKKKGKKEKEVTVIII